MIPTKTFRLSKSEKKHVSLPGTSGVGDGRGRAKDVFQCKDPQRPNLLPLKFSMPDVYTPANKHSNGKLTMLMVFMREKK